MKIIGIAATPPSKKITNEDILGFVDFYSSKNFDGDLPKTLKIIDKLLVKTGIESRYWLDDGEQPMTLLEAAFERALAQANIAREDIDLLVYPNVSRGFTEPASSAFVAKALGLKCRNFDVVDACMGWVSAMDVINDKMRAGSIKHAVIVNMEFLTIDNGPVFPKNFALNSVSELAYKFPSYTMGEAVAVTILGNDEPDNFKFSYINRPDLSNLCTITLPGWQSFCDDSSIDMIAMAQKEYQFNSYGSKIHEIGQKEVINVFNQHKLTKDEIDCVLTHTSSPELWGHCARVLGLSDKMHNIGHKVGNVITTSIPLGIADAIQQNVVGEGQSCLGWVGSAGMVFSAMTFRL